MTRVILDIDKYLDEFERNISDCVSRNDLRKLYHTLRKDLRFIDLVDNIYYSCGSEIIKPCDIRLYHFKREVILTKYILPHSKECDCNVCKYINKKDVIQEVD